MDSLFGFGVAALDLASPSSSSSRSSVATEISSSLNFRTFVLFMYSEAFLLALPAVPQDVDGERGDGDDDEDAALAPPPLGLRVVAAVEDVDEILDLFIIIIASFSTDGVFSSEDCCNRFERKRCSTFHGVLNRLNFTC